MIKSRTICMLMVLAVAFGSTEKAAGVNPAEWDFSLETYGSDASWTSLTNVDTGYPQYDYVWELTYADVNVSNNWVSVLGYIVPSSGSGSASGLPFEILDQDYLGPGMFGGHVHSYVDGSGFGHVDITNVYLGTSPYIVDSFRCGGTLDVTGIIPEPATIVLLGTAGIWIFTRKKRSA
jgi:hypothetical protein